MNRHPAFDPLMEMESNVKDVRRWALVLLHLAASEHAIGGEEVHVVASRLHDVGKVLEAEWQIAFEAARGQA